MSEAEKSAPSNIFEGMTSIRAVIKAIESGLSDRRIERIYFDEARARARAKELSYLRAMSFKLGYELIPTPSLEIDALALGSSHGGLICECTSRSYPELTAEIIRRDIPKNERFFAILEGIEDPYNFGYAIRSLYSAGVDAIILTRRNWMSAAGVVCRASAGASELCPAYVADPAETVAVMRELGVRIICTDIKNSISVYDADLAKPLLLAVGGEKRGLSRELLGAADEIVRLEYGRDFPAALSAASAAAIAAYEVLRFNRG